MGLIRQVLLNINRMHPLALSVLRGGLLLSNAMLISAITLIIYSDSVSATYATELCNIADTLRGYTFAVLFEVVFGSAIIEELSHRK